MRSLSPRPGSAVVLRPLPTAAHAGSTEVGDQGRIVFVTNALPGGDLRSRSHRSHRPVVAVVVR